MLEIMCPQEGKEQDQNTLRGIGRAQGWAQERKEEASHSLSRCLHSGPWAPALLCTPRCSGRGGRWSGKEPEAVTCELS